MMKIIIDAKPGEFDTKPCPNCHLSSGLNQTSGYIDSKTGFSVGKSWKCDYCDLRIEVAQ